VEASSVLEVSHAQSQRIINRVKDAIDFPENFRLFVLYKCNSVVGAVCLDICDAYVSLAGTVTLDAARTLIAAFRKEFGTECIGVRGCDGPPSAVDAFSSACSEDTGACAHSRSLVEMMVLDVEPNQFISVPGRLISISQRSTFLPQLSLWFEQFERDTENQGLSLGGQHKIKAHLQEVAARGDLYAWEVKEKPVAMVIMGRLRPKQLLCVYTPPHHRRKGYGQAVTAAVCVEHRQATGGMEPITLAAVHKFGAAKVYERIGFRTAGWLSGASFEYRSNNIESNLANVHMPGEIAGDSLIDLEKAMFDDDSFWPKTPLGASMPLSCFGFTAAVVA